MFIDYDGDRTMAQLEIIKKINPDIIMLQEVHGRQKILLEKSLTGYKTFSKFVIDESTMGCLIFCKNDLNVQDSVYQKFASTFMERGIDESTMGCLIFCKNDLNVQDSVYQKFASTFMERGISAICVQNVWYITTHLESMEKPECAAIRLRQLSELWKFILDKKTFVIGMDSNIKHEITCPSGVIDLCQNDNTPTWFANRFFGYEDTARYDITLPKTGPSATMHSATVYNFCCWDEVDSVLTLLDSFDDIDILYKDGAIIRTAMAKNQVTILRAALDYFENKQFPIKDDKYEEASRKLMEILDFL